MNYLPVVLNLFAGNTNVTTDSGLSGEMKTFYSDYLIDMAEPYLVHDQFGQKHPIPKNGGKTIEFRKYSPFAKALTPITEGVTPDGHKLSVTNLTATVAQYGDYVELSDVLLLTAIDNNLVEATKLCGNQAGETLDTVTREVLVGGTNVQYSGGVSDRSALTAEHKLTVDDCFKAARFLKTQKAKKIDGYYVAIIHPDVAYDLMRSEDWINAAQYAGSAQLFEGEIGRVAGIRFVETTEAKIFEGGKDNCAVYACLFLGKGAYGVVDLSEGTEVIVKPRGSSGTADPLDQRSSVGWKGVHAAAILYDEYIVRVECGSSYSAQDKAN
jgi:N4-gp56 family major capsid protein